MLPGAQPLLVAIILFLCTSFSTRFAQMLPLQVAEFESGVVALRRWHVWPLECLGITFWSPHEFFLSIQIVQYHADTER